MDDLIESSTENSIATAKRRMVMRKYYQSRSDVVGLSPYSTAGLVLSLLDFADKQEQQILRLDEVYEELRILNGLQHQAVAAAEGRVKDLEGQVRQKSERCPQITDLASRLHALADEIA